MLNRDNVKVKTYFACTTQHMHEFHLHDVDERGFRSLLVASGYCPAVDWPGPCNRIYHGLQILINRGADYRNLTL